MAEENQGTKPPVEQPNEPLPRTYNQLLGTNKPSKTSWPEMVGLTAEEAENKIKEEMEGVEVQVLPTDSFVTFDFNRRRVRLFVDESLKVAREPIIG